MKAILILAVLGLSANAAPSIGTKAKYQVTDSVRALSRTETYEVESANSDQTEFVVTYIREFPDETQVYHPEMLAEEIYDATILVDCGKNGGTLESVTVPAGTFDACKTENDRLDGHVESWQGLTPFLDIKTIITSPLNEKQTFELTEIVP